jgi:hypothetical protein
LNLYARFSAVVLADRDYAKELTENAKDIKYLKMKMDAKAGEDNDGSSSIGNGSSAASSSTSSKSKESLILKKKREVTEQRLDAPIRTFFRNSNLFTLFFALQMVAAPILSFWLIFTTNDGMILG